jgi:hypothetical protein
MWHSASPNPHTRGLAPHCAVPTWLPSARTPPNTCCLLPAACCLLPAACCLLAAGGFAGPDGFYRKAPFAALPLFVQLSEAGCPGAAQLSDKAVWRLVRVGPAEDAGLEGWARFSGHSLRAGLARPPARLARIWRR